MTLVLGFATQDGISYFIGVAVAVGLGVWVGAVVWVAVGAGVAVSVGDGVCEAVSVGSCARDVGVETAVTSPPHPSSNKQNKPVVKKITVCFI